MKIGGNTTAIIQTKTTTKNILGEKVEAWEDLKEITGYMDYVQGEADIQNFNAKVQETTHIFICSYGQVSGIGFNSEDSRIIYKGAVYQVLMIDDVMGLHEQVEIYLKYI